MSASVPVPVPQSGHQHHSGWPEEPAQAPELHTDSGPNCSPRTNCATSGRLLHSASFSSFSFYRMGPIIPLEAIVKISDHV